MTSEALLGKKEEIPKSLVALRDFLGGLEEIRTPDPHNANVVRSQLRYKPVSSNLTVL